MLLTVLTPGCPPMAHELEADCIVVGRAASATLVIHDPSLSRSHARIARDGESWVVEDLGSKNGTSVNGRDIRGPLQLVRGDRIELGRSVIVFEAEVPGALEATDEQPVTSGSRRGTGRSDEPPFLAGRSRATRELLALVDRVAVSDATVLLEGETGTGKELVARLLHHRGAPRPGPFVVVNCPAIAGSLFEAELFGVEKGTATGVDARIGRLEMAEGGTIFLDEVGDLDAAAQAKLLRFLQDRTFERVGGRIPLTVHARIVAASNRDLEAAVAAGTFRRDLLHRLDVVRIHLAPLRDRREDVPALVEHFLGETPGAPALGDDALAAMIRHDWPGNVRELEHAVARARLFASGVIHLEHLPPALRRVPADDGSPSDRLWQRVVEDGECFWDVVREPFLRREIPRDDVRELVGRALREGDGTVKDVARLFHVEDEHKRLLDFLGRHALKPDD